MSKIPGQISSSSFCYKSELSASRKSVHEPCVAHYVCCKSSFQAKANASSDTSKRVNKCDFVIRVHTATKSNVVYSTSKRANKCDFIIYLPLSLAAALPGSISEERGTCRCLKTLQSHVSRASLCRCIPITLWQTTLSQSHQALTARTLWNRDTGRQMLLLYTVQPFLKKHLVAV